MTASDAFDGALRLCWRRSHGLEHGLETPRIAVTRTAGRSRGRMRTMVLEVAPLRIVAGREAAFEAAFGVAWSIIASMPGYRTHSLHRCLERPGEYLLLVEWDSLEAHEQGFRGSPRYLEWKALLHAFYDPFPTVSHYVPVNVPVDVPSDGNRR